MHGHFFGVFLGHVFDPDRRQSAVFQNRQMRKQIEMLKHHAHFAAHFVNALDVTGQLDPIDNDLAFLMLFQPIHATDHG